MKTPQIATLHLGLACLALACHAPEPTVVAPTTATTTDRSTMPTPSGSPIERLDARLDDLIAPDAELELLASGYEWAEGPEWISSLDGGTLIWSDVRANKAYKWTEAGGAAVYLDPSGFTGAYFSGKEPGSNRLFLDPDGKLMLCQHGDRRIARMKAPLSAPKSDFETVVGFYEGKRLNSPNDVDWHRNGDLYFTDPPYGLPGGQENSSVKELDFQGVYRYSPRTGEVTLLTKELARPNGIVFTPDYSAVIVANSQAENPIWMKYSVRADGTFGAGELFFDASPMVPGPQDGIPDGMAMHSSGTLFATGPGGILVLSPEGKHRGTIRTGQTTANCAFDDDESMLYITADSLIMRMPMASVRGVPAERG